MTEFGVLLVLLRPASGFTGSKTCHEIEIGRKDHMQSHMQGRFDPKAAVFIPPRGNVHAPCFKLRVEASSHALRKYYRGEELWCMNGQCGVTRGRKI